MERRSSTLLFMAIITALFTTNAFGKQHVVGESQGWDESTDFTTWASGQTFKVGDQLVFKYTPGLHSVVELGSESAYKNCDLGTTLDSKNTGNDAIKLNKVGTRYFACGTVGHCDQGMKLKIKTVAADSAPSSSGTPPSSTSTSSACKNDHSLAFVALVALVYLVAV